MIESRLRPDALFCKTWRLRRSVRVESRSFDVASARPESRTADFMRVSFPRDGISYRALWRHPPGKASDRQIEASPEKRYGAGLSLKAGAKLFKYLVNPDQHSPKFMSRFRVIRRVSVVFLKRNGIGNLTRHRPDPHIDAHLVQCRHKLLVKPRNTLRSKSQCDRATV